MKKIKLNKLELKKISISSLDRKNLTSIKGGDGDPHPTSANEMSCRKQ